MTVRAAFYTYQCFMARIFEARWRMYASVNGVIMIPGNVVLSHNWVVLVCEVSFYYQGNLYVETCGSLCVFQPNRKTQANSPRLERENYSLRFLHTLLLQIDIKIILLWVTTSIILVAKTSSLILALTHKSCSAIWASCRDAWRDR